MGSFVLHAGALALNRASDHGPGPPTVEDSAIDIDIYTPPTPRRAEQPTGALDSNNQPTVAQATRAATNVATTRPRRRSSNDNVFTTIRDAGVATPDDAHTGSIARDARPSLPSDATQGPKRVAQSVPPHDAATPMLPTNNRDASVAKAKLRRSPGASANLLAYAPGSSVISVLVRLSRLRGTEWAARTESILKPMPDYQMLVGKRTTPLSKAFSTLAISTPNPSYVDATIVAVKTTMSRETLRHYLGQQGIHFQWQATRGGFVGKRPKHTRVLFLPYEGWGVIAQPKHLGALLDPPDPGIDAPPMPRWLRRLRRIESSAGGPRGAAVVVTARGFGNEFRIPIAAAVPLPGPTHLTAAITVVKQGWLVGGTAAFQNEQQAQVFVTQFEKARQPFVASATVGRAVLRTAYNAVKGITIVREGRLVAFETSVSISDARAIMARATTLVTQHYHNR